MDIQVTTLAKEQAEFIMERSTLSSLLEATKNSVRTCIYFSIINL